MSARPVRQKTSGPDDIQYGGFRRVDVEKSATHKAKLEEDGLVFCGFYQTQDRARKIPLQRAREPEVIVISSDDEADPRGVSAAGPPASASSSRSTSSAPRRTTATSNGSRVGASNTRSTSALKAASTTAVPKVPLKASHLSFQAKRGIPGEFTIPGRGKRRKKEEQRQSQHAQERSGSMPSSKRSHSSHRSASSSASPAEAILVGGSNDEEPVAKRPRRKESHSAGRAPVDSRHEAKPRVTPVRDHTASNRDIPDIVLSEFRPVALYGDNAPYDSDQDYDTFHDMLNLDRASNWKPVPGYNRAQVWDDEGLSARLAGMAVSTQLPDMSNTARRHQLRGKVGRRQCTAASVEADDYGQPYIWTMLRRHRIHRPDSFVALRHLRPVATLREHAPGGVNRIAQSNGTIAIASAASGGHEDPDALSSVDPYNREGTLSVWYEGEEHALTAHQRVLDNADTDAATYSLTPVRKHYAVQDVQFNPANPARLVSSANDRTVCVWDCGPLSDGEVPNLVHTEEYSCTMGKLLFKPDDLILAMGAHNGSVHLLWDGSEPTKGYLRMSGRNTDEIGDIAWGLGTLADKLFACSMTKEEKAFRGTHKVFDAEEQRAICTLNIQEAGDSIAVHPAGTLVAVATKPSKYAHSLYLFDGRRLNPNPVHHLELDSFQQSVTTMKFSPDGVYLALARDDNTTDVYDARFLGHGRKLHAFTHEQGNVLAYTKDVYGVVEAEWVEGYPAGLGLVTGGCDGCVRLWDVRLADNDPNNGQPIAQCEHDLGHFSLGDSFNDVPLVTGEMSGKVTIFDRRGGRR